MPNEWVQALSTIHTCRTNRTWLLHFGRLVRRSKELPPPQSFSRSSLKPLVHIYQRHQKAQQEQRENKKQ